MTSVVVLDGNQRSALATARSLGIHGVDVIVGDEAARSLAGVSRYCRDRFTYPSPIHFPDEFVSTLAHEATARKVDAILPMTDVTTALTIANRDRLGGISLPFADLEAFDVLSDKRRLVELGRELGIPTPATWMIQSTEELQGPRWELSYPVVLKPFRSRILAGKRWVSASVKYAGSAEELEEVVQSTGYFREHPFLIQEKIEGQGQGIFALYDHGKPVAFFAHKRVREKPPSGGVSVVSESVALPQEMREFSERLLSHVQWHGVAMVEFKVTSAGVPYLMEVNARFWGSLQLAVDAGVDFPWLAFELARRKRCRPPENYTVGVRTRWLLGDLDHLLLVLRGPVSDFMPWPSRWRTLRDFLRFRQEQTRYEVNRWNDIKPFLLELGQYVRALI